MKERPIIFDAESVRAILEGRKTQTRRVIKPQPALYLSGRRSPVWRNAKNTGWFSYANESRHSTVEHRCPYGGPGDGLWVKEAWSKDNQPLCLNYKATSHPSAGFTWAPAEQMPRWASRITPEVTDVRVELDAGSWVWVVDFERVTND